MTNESEKTFDKELPVKLTDHEIQSYGRFLGDKLNERELMKLRQKQAAAEWTAKIKTIDNDLKRLGDATSKGAELRMVKCFERWNAGTIETVRTDTGAVVESRAADARDRQVEIPGIDDAEIDAPVDQVGPDGESVGDMQTSSSGDEVYIGNGDNEADDVPAQDDDAPADVGDGPPLDDDGHDIETEEEENDHRPKVTLRLADAPSAPAPFAKPSTESKPTTSTVKTEAPKTKSRGSATRPKAATVTPITKAPKGKKRK